jgi:hypothetical protein
VYLRENGLLEMVMEEWLTVKRRNLLEWEWAIFSGGASEA